MNPDEEDEALTWAGGRDPSHYETPEAKAPKARKPPKPSKSVAAPVEGADVDELNPGMSAPVLVSLGILGGIYLLYTIGWVVSLGRFLYRFTTELELIAFHTEQVLAIAAAPLWFTVTLLLTRDRMPAVRLIWLLVGALVLVPWSFVFGL